MIVLLLVCSIVLFLPMPHGGRLIDGLVYEIKTYIAEIPERERESEIERQRQEEVEESLKNFREQNPQYFPKR